MKKNQTIDIWRYFFTIFICILHFKEYFGENYPFGGGYLAVEFFFVLSGFFVMSAACKTIKKNNYSSAGEATVDYFWRRVKKLYPQYLFSLAFLAIYVVFIRKSISGIEYLRNGLPEIFLLQMSGIGNSWRINSAMWYVSALILGSAILFYLALKFKKEFGYIICPAMVVLIYSFFWQSRGRLGGVGWNKTTLIVQDGLFRGLAGMGVGCLVCLVYNKYGKNFTKYKLLRTFIELAIAALTVWKFYGPGNTVTDFYFVGLFAILILSVLSGEGSYLSNLLSKIPINSKYAYAMYCNHWLINCAIKDYFPGHPFYPMTFIYLVITIIVSIVSVKLIESITAFVNKHKNPAYTA